MQKFSVEVQEVILRSYQRSLQQAADAGTPRPSLFAVPLISQGIR